MELSASHLLLVAQTFSLPVLFHSAFGGIHGNKLDDIILKRNAFDGVLINIPWSEIKPASGTLVMRINRYRPRWHGLNS